jgi:hypothetical protein
MTDDQTDQEALELLHVLGRVDAPSAAVLAAARESLWSAVTDELLAADTAEEATNTQPREARRPAARPRPGQSRPIRRRHGDEAP